MAQTPKKKKLLPKNIVNQPDSVIAEKLFGKRAKKEIDRLIDTSSKPMKEV